MSWFNPFARRPATPPHPTTGDPVRDMTEVLLRIEAHLADITTRTKSIDRLERRLLGIETALKNI